MLHFRHLGPNGRSWKAISDASEFSILSHSWLSLRFSFQSRKWNLRWKGSIVINSGSLLQPTSNSIVLSLNASIYVPGPFTVHTAPSDLQLYLPPVGSQYPVGTIHLQGETIRGNTSIVIEEQYLPFENYSSWQTFIHNAITFDSGPLGLKGPIFTRLGKIKGFILQLDKWSTSKGPWLSHCYLLFWIHIILLIRRITRHLGFKQFAGFSIDSAQLILPAERDGTNLIATATLPNPSILTLEVVR